MARSEPPLLFTVAESNHKILKPCEQINAHEEATPIPKTSLSLSLYLSLPWKDPFNQSLFSFLVSLSISFYLSFYILFNFICSLWVDKWLALQHQNQCRRGRLNQSGQNSVQSFKPRSILNHSKQPAFTGWAPLGTGYTRWECFPWQGSAISLAAPGTVKDVCSNGVNTRGRVIGRGI